MEKYEIQEYYERALNILEDELRSIDMRMGQVICERTCQGIAGAIKEVKYIRNKIKTELNRKEY